ncbi:helix-turn-helix domain-containing protein [Agathobaculum desmolans]|uniref:helix-turn-helix domain-containing protein n=1 Tax=Agathobaculum desmolans TaxID=39484 RepID=UPI000689FD07|nr:helix-turn-helix domain-containing protein [Agathobaculum desmolans]
MKDKSKAKQAIVRRVDIDTILRAKSGDQTALEKVLEHYKGYMLELCQFELYDASGRVYTCYDEELYHELQLKLMIVVLENFNLE